MSLWWNYWLWKAQTLLWLLFYVVFIWQCIFTETVSNNLITDCCTMGTIIRWKKCFYLEIRFFFYGLFVRIIGLKINIEDLAELMKLMIFQQRHCLSLFHLMNFQCGLVLAYRWFSSLHLVLGYLGWKAFVKNKGTIDLFGRMSVFKTSSAHHQLLSYTVGNKVGKACRAFT